VCLNEGLNPGFDKVKKVVTQRSLCAWVEVDLGLLDNVRVAASQARTGYDDGQHLTRSLADVSDIRSLP